MPVEPTHPVQGIVSFAVAAAAVATPPAPTPATTSDVAVASTVAILRTDMSTSLSSCSSLRELLPGNRTRGAAALHRPGGRYLGVPAPGRLGGELRAVAHAELGVDVRQVGLDGGACDEQPLRDLGVGESGGGLADDLGLGRCQTFPAEAGALALSAGAPQPRDRVFGLERSPLTSR